MKIVTPPRRTDRPASTRDVWIWECLILLPGAAVVATHYRDAGRSVRFQFANHAEAEWKWLTSSPTQVFGDVVAAGWLDIMENGPTVVDNLRETD